MTNQRDQIDETASRAIRSMRAGLGTEKAALAKAMGITVDELDAIEGGSAAPTFAQIVRAADCLELPIEAFLTDACADSAGQDGTHRPDQAAIRRIEAIGRMKGIRFDIQELAGACGPGQLLPEAARILDVPVKAITDRKTFEKAVPPIFKLNEEEWDEAKRVVGGRIQKLLDATGGTREKLSLDMNYPNPRIVTFIIMGRRFLSRTEVIAYAEYFDVTPEALYDKGDATVDGLSAKAAGRTDGGLLHGATVPTGSGPAAPTRKQIGRHIWLLRRARKIGRRDLARKLGIRHETIGFWENGIQLTTYTMLSKIAECLDAPVDILLDGKALVKFIKGLADKDGRLPGTELLDRLELALVSRNMDTNSLATSFGVSARDFRSWVDLSSRLSMDDAAEAVGLPKEVLLGNAIPGIA